MNQGHLRWATPVENHADKIGHGTTNRGERQGASRLTEAQVLEIRGLAGLVSKAEIGRRYGVDRSHVSKIISRDVWTWLP